MNRLKSQVHSAVVYFVSRGAMLAAVATGMTFLGRLWWFFELATHFRVQLAAASFVVLIGALTLRLWRTALAATVMTALHVAFIGPLYFASSHGGQATIRLVSMNVYSGNDDVAAVQDYLLRSDPDLVLVQELTGEWSAALSESQKKLPYRILISREGNFGIGLLSRYPLESMRPDLLAGEIPVIVATIDAPDGKFTLVGAHTFPPAGSTGSRRRNELLQRVGQLVAQIEGPVILAGDLNATSWSPQFQDLMTISGLRDTRYGYGVQPTWPAGRWWLQIPIDHCLVSHHWTIHDRQVGLDVGSDHYPVQIDLGLSP